MFKILNYDKTNDESIWWLLRAILPVTSNNFLT